MGGRHRDSRLCRCKHRLFLSLGVCNWGSCSCMLLLIRPLLLLRPLLESARLFDLEC